MIITSADQLSQCSNDAKVFIDNQSITVLGLLSIPAIKLYELIQARRISVKGELKN